MGGFQVSENWPCDSRRTRTTGLRCASIQKCLLCAELHALSKRRLGNPFLYGPSDESRIPALSCAEDAISGVLKKDRRDCAHVMACLEVVSPFKK